MVEFGTIVPPAGMAITVAEAKQHLRVDIADDDLLITAQILGAQKVLEDSEANRYFTQRTVSATFDVGDPHWDGYCAHLWYPPVQSIVEVAIVEDFPTNVVIINPAMYVIDKELGRLRFAPSALDGGGAAGRLRVKYVAGYTQPPEWAQIGVKLLVGHLYENREGVVVGAGVSAIEVPRAISDFVRPYRHTAKGDAL